MDILIKLGYNNFKVINEVTSKVMLSDDNYIFKLVPYVNTLPYLEIQNNGGSKYIPRIYEVKQFYFEELNKDLIYKLKHDRKSYEYKDQKSLYLVKFEYIQGVPYFDYFGKQIPSNYLSKLIKETFTGLDIIHNTGYYHGDLGMPNNIILEGTLSNWKRVVIIDIEGGKITDRKQVDDDISTLAYCIWQIIVGNVAETEDSTGNMIVPENSMFINLVKNNMTQFKQYKSHLELLLWIFINKPTTAEILKRV